MEIAIATFTSFQNPTSAGQSNLSDQLRSNMQAFVDWGLLGLGYFLNVNTGTVYPYGGSPSTLHISNDNRFPAGTAWDTFKTNLVWEQGVEAATQPINISGIYVNGVFLPIGTTGVYTFNINYPLGRVIFTSPIPANSKVQLEYSYKYYNVYPDTVQWFKQLTQGTFRIDDPQWGRASGIWSIYPDSRSQLPAVVIEISPRTKGTPKGLGGGQWIWKDILFHVFSETAWDRDNVMDVFSFQKDKRFFIFDKNLISVSQAFPLSAYGYLVNPSSTYPNLINNYVWRDCIVRDIAINRSDNSPQSVYYGVAQWTISVDMPDII